MSTFSGPSYSLTFMNNSDRQGTLCLYLHPVGAGVELGTGEPVAPLSLAWQTRLVPLGSQAEIAWGADYAFAWAESGALEPGAIFEAAQQIPADPANSRKSAIALNYRWGAYTFETTERRADPGSLCIFSEASVPENLAAVSICLAGKPALAWNTRPDRNFTFRPAYRCRAAFGCFEEGQVLDPATLAEAHEVQFPASGGARTLELDQAGRWHER